MRAAAAVQTVMSRRPRRTVALALVFALCVAAARPFELPGGASPWYPATGVLIAWLALDGPLVGVVAVAARTSVLALMGDHSVATELVRSAGVVAVYAIAVALIADRLRVREGVRRLALFASVGVLVAPLVAACVSSLVMWAFDESDDAAIRTFFVGDAIGALAVAPVLLGVLRVWRPERFRAVDRTERREMALQAFCLVAVPASASVADLDGLFPVVAAIGLLPLMWVAVRRDPLQVAVGVLLATTSTVVAVRIAVERGPADASVLLTVQSLILTAALVAWFVSATRLDDVRRSHELVRVQQAVAWAATHDRSTGLLNRQGFAIAVADTAHGRQVAAVDLGVPAETLELLGAQFTDDVAVTVAERLRSVVGDDSPIGRLGPDLLGVLLPASGGGIAVDAPRVLAPLAEPLAHDGVELHPVPHLGLARDGRSDSAVDQATFAAHAARRRGVAALLFDDELDGLAAAERSRLSELQRALGNEEIVAWFQPIVRTVDRQIVGVEALARWVHPRLGVLGAAEFVPTAESSGLVNAVGRAVRLDALRCIAALEPLLADRPFHMSVNVSGSELDERLVDEILGGTEAVGVSPTRIRIEVTETVAVTDVGQAREVLARLRGAGMSVAIDDFGTGQSSMAQLHALPVDELKIDARFVRGLPAVRDIAIVRSIRTLADDLHLEVVAEGVENEAQLQALEQCEVGHVQGFLTGRPMPVDQLVVALGGFGG